MSPARDPETYLEHASYVRSLARRLVYDVHAADDLFQEAWLAALQRAPRDGSLPKRWWRALLRNLALDAWLADERRRDRELSSEAPKPTSSPADVLEHESERRRLVAALLELDEPYRSTLIARFFDGLDVRELAARTGVPLETVRTRQKRGLALLRAKLSRSGLGAAFASKLGLGGPDAAAVTARILTGGLFVGTTKKLVCAAVVVLVAFIGWRVGSDAAEPVDPASLENSALGLVTPPDGDGPSPDDDTRAAAATDSLRSMAPSSGPASPRASHGGLRVHVAWSDGVAAAGILVSAGATNTSNFDAGVRELRTDEHGTAFLDELAPGEWLVELDRGVQSRSQVRAAATTDVALTIPAGFAVRGRVLDVDGRPFAGAAIHLSRGFRAWSGGVVAESDASGHFAVRDLAEDDSQALSALASRRAPSRQQAVAGAVGETIEVELAFEATGGDLTGRVLDVDGRPIAGASVIAGASGVAEFARAAKGVELPLAARRAFTDGDGVYRIAGLALGVTPVAAVASTFAPFSGATEIVAGREQRLDVVLEHSPRLVGSVLDEHERPVEGALLRVGDWGITGALARSAADGGYVLDGLPIGEFEVRAEREGLGEARVTLVGAPAAVLRWDAKLDRERTLRGRVIAPGRELAGWTVDARAMNVGDGEWFARAATDAAGRFEFTNCPEFLLHLEVFSPTSSPFAVAVADDVDPLAGEVRLHLDPSRERSARIAGRVVDPAGNPVAGAEVFCFPAPLGTSSGVLTTSGADGRFTSESIPAGSWRLSVGAEGLARTITTPQHVRTGDTLDWGDIVLSRGGTLVVEVVAESGIDVAAVRIGLVGDAGGELFGHGVAEVRDGRASFSAIPRGDYRLTPWGADVALRTIEVNVADGRETRARLELVRGREVRVDVVHADGRAVVERLETELRDANGRLLDDAPLVPFGAGACWLRRLSVGSFVLAVEDGRGHATRVEFAVDAGPELASDEPLVLRAVLR
ncbi:MAG: sigma-70 family RNA polymerase sigma factor [Planctomycetes bacterium]|nr:sigma-70 family RNA polymerase sigma factor [Planctomycetota bacterium]